MVGATASVVIGVLVHRDLARIAAQVERAGLRPDIQQDIDQLWGDAKQLHDDHARVVDRRLREVEAAVAQVQQSEAGLARYVNWMVPLVQRWAEASAGGDR